MNVHEDNNTKFFIEIASKVCSKALTTDYRRAQCGKRFISKYEPQSNDIFEWTIEDSAHPVGTTLILAMNVIVSNNRCYQSLMKQQYPFSSQNLTRTDGVVLQYSPLHSRKSDASILVHVLIYEIFCPLGPERRLKGGNGTMWWFQAGAVGCTIVKGAFSYGTIPRGVSFNLSGICRNSIAQRAPVVVWLPHHDLS